MNRRATTHGVLTDSNFGNLQTHIPQLKPSRLSAASLSRPSMGEARTSMGFSRARSSLYQENFQPPHFGEQRQSLSRASMTRRSSAFSRPSSSLGNGVLKDPRPIRDKQFQQQCINQLITFLLQNGYNQSISPKLLAQPTGKDFQNIFKFLYHMLDPQYIFLKKFEDEVLMLLKGLRYPFADQITKSQLFAVGAMHSWPVLLAMLMWMVDLIKCSDVLDQEPTFSDGAIDDDNSQTNKAFFEYVTKAYVKFLSGHDDFASLEAELGAFFDKKNEVFVKEIEKLLMEKDTLHQELEALGGLESPLIALEKERQTLHSDKEKFIQYLQHIEQKKMKMEIVVNRIKEEFEGKEKELQELQEEKKKLEDIVASQELSITDVDRMNAEKQQLSKSLSAATVKQEELAKKLWENEISFQKQIDKIESFAQKYNALGIKLGFLKMNGESGGVFDELTLNIHATQKEDIVSQNLQESIRPRIVQCRQQANKEIYQAQEVLFGVNEAMESMSESIADKTREIEAIEGKIRHITAQYNKERESVASENHKYSDEMEELERGLQKLRIDGTAGLLTTQQRIQKVKMEFEQHERVYNEQKMNLYNDTIKVVDDILEFKQAVERELIQLEDLLLEESNSLTEEMRQKLNHFKILVSSSKQKLDEIGIQFPRLNESL